MATARPSALRNLGIVAHIDAGKTTVSERILFYTGVERRMGEVHEGSAVMDWMSEERRRGITITSAATSVPWRDHVINLIDTPGHVDFTVEVERCMRVLDGAVLVLNGVSGVQAQTETVWRQMVRHGVRAVAFVNQMDRPGADFLGTLSQLQSRLGVPAVPIQYPLGVERDFRGLVDLIGGVAMEFPEERQGRDPVPIEIPPEVADEVGVLRSELLEVLAEGDESLLESYLEGLEPDPEALRAALRKRVLDRSLMPVLCGSALRNVGIQCLLDAVVDYLPSPLEVPPLTGKLAGDGSTVKVEADPAAEPVLLAFKHLTDRNEELLFARIYSGTVRPGSKLYNTRVGRMERISRLLRMHADSRTPMEEAGPGDIVALAGLKLTATGDTLASHDHPVQLERPHFPEPVITRVVEPVSSADRDRLRLALGTLAHEDPSFRVREEEETGQWLIAGMGELHLEIKETLLVEQFALDVRVGQPRVAYREAPSAVGRGSGMVDRQLAGRRIFGAVELEVRPIELESGVSGAEAKPMLVSWAEGCAVPLAFRDAVAADLALEAAAGPRFGYPLTGLELVVVGGASNPDRDFEQGFLQAAGLALREALASARIALLEPLMSFEIRAPAEYMSGILGELNAKKAVVANLTAEGETRCVTGEVALYRIFGYASTLRSLSRGLASFSLIPAGFRRVAEEELEQRGMTWS